MLKDFVLNRDKKWLLWWQISAEPLMDNGGYPDRYYAAIRCAVLILRLYSIDLMENAKYQHGSEILPPHEAVILWLGKMAKPTFLMAEKMYDVYL